MRADLLHALASIEWAESHFHGLDRKLTDWVNTAEVTLKDIPNNTTHNLIIVSTPEPLPIFYSVEVGAYANAIRSSLDILASSLAIRHGIEVGSGTQFPISKSLSEFEGRYRGKKFFGALPFRERAIIESFKPYRGGNNSLWGLHHIDIVRKHRRLLRVEMRASGFWITQWGLSNDFTRISTGYLANDDELILGFLSKGRPMPQINFSGYVAIDEPEYGHRPVIDALKDFSATAKSVILAFDD